MNAAIRIAREEWRQWRRSRLAVAALTIFGVLLIVTSVLTAGDMLDARQDRLHQQAHAEATFLDQPARHPHRMVHYGHYVFRAPAPLAVFDPGVDAVTGQSVFLEGHRQNGAMFADARAQARAGGFGDLSPAALYHLFLPLLLIAIGHAVILREREARTLGPLLSQGVTGRQLYAGKSLALLAMIGLLSVPALIASLSAIPMGEPVSTALGLYAGQLLYLCVWGALIVLVSAIVRSRGVALGLLLLVWFVTALIIPRIGVTAVGTSLPADGKIVSDMRMKEDIRKAGDGHNAADPAFAQLRANMLAEYGVDTVEELPVNFRGVVASTAEARLTDTLNDYAEQRMARERAQSDGLSAFGWLSPYIAVGAASRALAGTDLATHHRFLREAEGVRFDFVQGLNAVHAEQLAYSDDINRSSDPQAERRTRVDPKNWKVLRDFRFTPDTADVRIARAADSLLALTVWLFALIGLGLWAARRMSP
ncbi:DUF3526 domain-containing protein [uncultured Algimonas sp.]|uniref:ABC transporter permease n=1 Tax=uncultured Algimonas sp. TaxID=1547920 RepID=UPI002614E44E|nr:DUF3526 domain-containing protein [uncultured Algimonas sp.]